MIIPNKPTPRSPELTEIPGRIASIEGARPQHECHGFGIHPFVRIERTDAAAPPATVQARSGCSRL
jgi:hypothetical protein